MSVTTSTKYREDSASIQRSTSELEQSRRELEEQRHQLEYQRRQLEREQREFQWQKEMDARSRARDEQMLTMKQQLLEDELRKLAKEKEYVGRQKAFYDRVIDWQQTEQSFGVESVVVRAELFFAGVESEIALKKRYRDLIKIYHPDNLCGNKETLQEINREYDRLRREFEAC
jgi:hypothetical protein